MSYIVSQLIQLLCLSRLLRLILSVGSDNFSPVYNVLPLDIDPLHLSCTLVLEPRNRYLPTRDLIIFHGRVRHDNSKADPNSAAQLVTDGCRLSQHKRLLAVGLRLCRRRADGSRRPIADDELPSHIMGERRYL